eukprot:6757528-Pyramimonas_sp.AAC.1
MASAKAQLHPAATVPLARTWSEIKDFHLARLGSLYPAQRHLGSLTGNPVTSASLKRSSCEICS